MTLSTKQRILRQAKRWPSTQLAVGVVSKTAVEATIELANHFGIDLMLIPSRRQVDMDSLGSGYVEKWNARRFADFVRKRDKNNRILLCRDHGGPWQNNREMADSLCPEDAMASAKRSFEEDIEAGFDMLHLDPSVSPDGAQEEEIAFSFLFELFEHCHSVAEKLRKNLAFEVGTEEQGTLAESPQGLERWLKRIKTYAVEHGREAPLFVVVQTGTKVMEMRNIGSLGSPFRVPNQLPTSIGLPRIVDIAHQYGFLIKQHNTDYLSSDILSRHPELRIDSANVAPEFGVVESKALVYFTEAHGLLKERDAFLELALGSRKWEKWMLPNTRASDREKALIAGHYVFSTDAYQELLARIQCGYSKRGNELEEFLRNAVSNAITRYISNFRLVTP
ncbi:MAG: tagatose-6-phosphate kinase [Hahellaceae bacterium]|nr:tagatose-6-phosphate kinase [Hahellaceae bacterium]